MFNNGLTKFVQSMFDGYREAKKGDFTTQFAELEWTPLLFSSNYLDDMYDKAKTKEDYYTILDHMYRHDATEVESYRKIEQKIIDRYWR